MLGAVVNRYITELAPGHWPVVPVAVAPDSAGSSWAVCEDTFLKLAQFCLWFRHILSVKSKKYLKSMMCGSGLWMA